MKYAFIRKQAEACPVKLLCQKLGVTRSAYYDWRDRPGRVIPAEKLILRQRMKALFKTSCDSLSSRTLARKLREEGFEIGRDRTHRLMKDLNLEVKQNRKYKATTDSKHNLPVAKNVLNRQFNPSAPPNWARGTDISVPQQAAGEMRDCGPSSSACRCW